jgi:hypothetical protein
MPQNPAATIHKNITRPAADIIKQFEVPTGYIADVQGRRGALDSLTFRGVAGPLTAVSSRYLIFLLSPDRPSPSKPFPMTTWPFSRP